LLGYLVLGAYALLLGASAPPWPDDWDGVGFVESVRDFDLARFHPHAPGYPVYVAMLRAAYFVVRDPMRACIVVAACSGAVAIALIWDATRRLAGLWAAYAVAVLVAILPIIWRACSGVGSEAPALVCAAACAWGLVTPRTAGTSRWRHALVLGLGAGLGLGVRLSWAPLYVGALALAPRGQRARVWAVAAAGCCAWAVPLIAVVGWSRLIELGSSHLAGHFDHWGGTVATQPGGVRLAWLLRDVFVDGFGVGTDLLGMAIAVLVAAGLVMALVAWAASGWPAWRSALVVAGLYVVWIAIGQNLRDQPRHALPIVALLGTALALRAARTPRAFGVVCTLALLVSMRTAHDALARRSIPPPGEQIVGLVQAQPAESRPIVFGAASVRFFELGALASNGRVAGSLGDVELQLTRLDRLPPRVWVTSEVDRSGDPGWPVQRVATLCRPPRLDRRAPCLDVDEWRLPYLPR
jgi:hypothetical protein